MHTERYPYPLCIQLAAPESLDSPEFLDTLKLLKDSGFYGVEMNLLDFSQAYAVRLKETLERFGLRLTMIASGAFANRNGLSLSSPDQGVRARSVQALGGMLDCAAGFGAGVICGFIKGGPSGDKAVASQQLRASLEELDRLGKTAAAPLYLEATNHYEALLVNTLEEGAALTAGLSHPVYILPDTYHMNIEETSTTAALTTYAGHYHNLHVSDNNRYFPGIGDIDFAGIMRQLKGLGYDGTITIEGRVLKSLSEDTVFSAGYLAGIGAQLGFWE